MRPELFIVFVLMAQVVFSQSSLTKDQVNRLADAGKVYGYIKYFHPYLQYRDINWDSAFSANVPYLLSAKNKNEYEKSLEKLLGVLQDPVTAVIHIPHPTTPIKYSDLVIVDSVMVITRDDYRAIVDEDTTHRLFSNAMSQFGKAKAVIFDLRPDKETSLLNEVPLQDIFEETEILSDLFEGILRLPATRTVTHNAFKGETADANSDYQSQFFIERKDFMTGVGKRNMPMIFIVNKYAELPIEALALQAEGKATIIQEEGAGEIGISPDVKFWIADSVLIRVRTGEIIQSDNGMGFYPNLIIPESNDRAIAVEKAKEILKGGIQPSEFPGKNFSGFTSHYTGNKLNSYSYPSLGERVLAAAKIYTVLNYFYPNKHLWTHNWDSVYLHFLPRFVLAADALDYLRTVMEFYTHVEDGHGSIRHPNVDFIRNGPPGLFPPFRVRIIENQLVVTNILRPSLANGSEIKVGDIILEKDGVNVMKELNEKRKFYSASNYEAQSGYIINGYLRARQGNPLNLKIKEASGRTKNISIPVGAPTYLERQKFAELNLKGNDKPVMYFITNEIGYVNLGGLTTVQVDSMFEMFRNTKAIIFDLRPYPHETARLIAPRLSEKYSIPSTENLPGTRLYDQDNIRKGWIYKGKAVCLMHENTQSHGESSVWWLKYGGATLIGNHTAGANGDTEGFFVPGGIRLSFSTYSVPMQGEGIQPDILVKPTIKGVQEGRDEILERAVKFIKTGK